MNRISFVLLLALIAGFLIASTPAVEAQAHHPTVVKGTVIGFNPANSVVGVMTRFGPLPVLVSPNTDVFINGHPARLLRLRPGMRGRFVGMPIPQRPALRAGLIQVRT